MKRRYQTGSVRARWAALVLVALLALGGASIYAVRSYQHYAERNSGQSAVSMGNELPPGQRIVFRNTASGGGYGMIGAVTLDDPAGPRGLADVPCDRVDASDGLVSCLRTIRGIPTRFEAQILDSEGSVIETWPLPGVPSRTRVSADGLVATTAFVTGHAYATNSFSTETVVRAPDGRDYGNLQDFKMLIDGKQLTAVDRNVWGVAFAGGDEFFATVASGNKTWLVSGSFEHRTLTSVMENAECPSISPDGKRVAFKKRRPGAGPVHWDIAVLELASKKETAIRLRDGFDDQLEWLDNSTLLYGVPRSGAIGDSDIFSLEVAPNARPELLIEHAWSPSVEH